MYFLWVVGDVSGLVLGMLMINVVYFQFEVLTRGGLGGGRGNMVVFIMALCIRW